MNRIIIDYIKLNKSLENLEKNHPSRIHGDIDLLSANIKDNLFNHLYWDELIVDIDNERKRITIWWKDIEWFVYAIYDQEQKPTTSEKMYNQIIQSIKQAKQFWFYENVFKETEDKNND